MEGNRDEQYMKQALQLAQKGEGYVAPNPMVGAVIVKDGRIIGSGYHEHYGGPHAEVNAIADAKEDVAGATMYVTLEPCSHYGKTPPCADLLVEKKLAKVVVGSLDPNPLVAGKGIQKLKEAGIEVVSGVLEAECNEINRVFRHYITTKQPYVVMQLPRENRNGFQGKHLVKTYIDYATNTQGLWLASTPLFMTMHALPAVWSKEKILCVLW